MAIARCSACGQTIHVLMGRASDGSITCTMEPHHVPGRRVAASPRMGLCDGKPLSVLRALPAVEPEPET